MLGIQLYFLVNMGAFTMSQTTETSVSMPGSVQETPEVWRFNSDCLKF